MNSMKEFKDLIFEDVAAIGGNKSIMEFDNNYGVIVFNTPHSYMGKLGLYTVDITYDGEIVVEIPTSINPIGHLTETEITEIMHELQKL